MGLLARGQPGGCPPPICPGEQVKGRGAVCGLPGGAARKQRFQANQVMSRRGLSGALCGGVQVLRGGPHRKGGEGRGGGVEGRVPGAEQDSGDAPSLGDRRPERPHSALMTGMRGLGLDSPTRPSGHGLKGSCFSPARPSRLWRSLSSPGSSASLRFSNRRVVLTSRWWSSPAPGSGWDSPHPTVPPFVTVCSTPP